MRRLLSALTSPPVILAAVAVLAYGLLVAQLGFYWDDLPMSWIRYQLGPEAMARYFSTNRPVWGLLYQLTTRVIPQVPVYWQVFALFWRWMTGMLVWATMRELFPKRAGMALSIALLFLVYPGFNQQWGSYLYSHFFIVLCFLLFSFYLMLRASRGRYWLNTGFGMFFSALNLWMHEYFFVLELLRPALLWVAMRDSGMGFRDRIRHALKLWAPYLAVFVAAVLSRLFVFNNQVYQFGGDQVGASPFNLLTTIPVSLWTVSVAAWGQVLRLPDLAIDGPRTTLAYGFVALVTYGILVGATFLRPLQAGAKGARREALWAIGLGVCALLVSGWPFWLTGVPVSLGHPANRATLAFMLGTSLVLGGVIALLPRRLDWILLAALLSLAAGRQFLWSNEFRKDWNTQKSMFWQMSWRAPGLQPGTIVLMNEQLRFYADNSLGAALNWVYAPEDWSGRVDYVLFYPTNRLGGALTGLQPGLPVSYDYLAGEFSGSTSQVVAFYYAPPGCLRLLDPEIDPFNRMIPEETLMRRAASISTSAPVTNQASGRMPEIYSPEPAQPWCSHFQQADLARQNGDWERVADLGDSAFALDDYPNDPVERFVFIEGYAHVGAWERALELSRVSYRVSKEYVGPLLCRLWDRIDRQVPASPQKTASVKQARTNFVCNP